MVDANFRVKNGLDVKGGIVTVDDGSIKIKERATAPADTEAYGQLWVKNSGDGLLYFTDDNGTDIQITTATAVNAGTVTSVTAGTGMTQTGTSTVNPTLNVGGLTVSELAAGSLQISSESFADNDTSLMTSAAIQDKILSYSYSSGGATALNGLTDVISNITNFGDSILISPDGAAPPHGTLNNAQRNVGLGKDSLAALTSGDDNIGIGFDAGKSINSGYRNIAIGKYALDAMTTGYDNIGIGQHAGGTGSTNGGSIYVGTNAGKTNASYGVIYIGQNAGMNANSTGNGYAIAIGTDAAKNGNSTMGLYIGFGAAEGHATNTTYHAASNTAIGHYSLKAIETGDDNLALGYASLQRVTSGSQNIGIGKNAGYYISTGARNIAIGAGALDAATTDSDNIAIGYNALGGAIAGGEKNVAIGNYSGDAVTSADGSVLVGHQAGSAITTGIGNVGLGYTSLLYNTTSNYNVAIGYESMAGQAAGAQSGADNIAIGRQASQYGNAGNSYSNISLGYRAMRGVDTTTTGSFYNIAIGQEAMRDMTNADKNVILGHQSAYRITTGGNNVGVGYRALDLLQTGMGNIGIGDEAGNSISTGSNNVVIGKADVPSATGDDQLSISSGDGGVTWITGDSDGNVKGTDFYMHAEWNDAYFTDSLRNGKRFSFGAGMNNNTNSDSGTIGTETILPRACTLEEMHFWIGNVGSQSGSGNFTVRVDKNGTELTTAYTFNMSGSGGNHVQKSFTPNVSFDAGETFNLTLHDAAGASYDSANQIGRIRVTFRFRTNN
jgi:hypothetical protein